MATEWIVIVIAITMGVGFLTAFFVGTGETRLASTSPRMLRPITNAARMLIGMVRSTERSEGGRTTNAELSLEVELTGGGVETWKITIERTASNH